MSQPIETRETLESLLKDKAATDPAFRKALLADPAAAIAEAFRLALAPGLSVRIIEETAGEVVLVLPRHETANVDPDELSEADLARAAGGFGSSVNGDVADAVTRVNTKQPGGFGGAFAIGSLYRPHFPFLPF